jgi:hypothetical protein
MAHVKLGVASKTVAPRTCERSNEFPRIHGCSYLRREQKTATVRVLTKKQMSKFTPWHFAKEDTKENEHPEEELLDETMEDIELVSLLRECRDMLEELLALLDDLQGIITQKYAHS